MTESLDCFKAYDIRGKVPEELEPDLACRIGLALGLETKARRAVVGRDPRLSGQAIAEGMIEGLRQAGVDVTDIGLCGTEEIYYATFAHDFEAGVMITASHNPPEYNGMKFVRAKAAPISGDTGLLAIKERVAKNNLPKAAKSGGLCAADFKPQYIKRLISYINPSLLPPFSIVADAGHGSAGPILKLLSAELPFKFAMLHPEPDGTFPKGVPNPLLPENRRLTAEAVRAARADLGLAWDGDFDRCFFYDCQGEFIEGYYLVGLLAQAMLQGHPGEKIIHDPRLT